MNPSSGRRSRGLQHAQHTKAAKSDKMKASVLALDVQSKMFDARMGAAVVQQQKQAEEQAQELKKKGMELAQEQKKLVLQAVQEQIGQRVQVPE